MTHPTIHRSPGRAPARVLARFPLLLAVVALPAGTLGETIYVPDDYPTIQQAIDAARSGEDEVVVRPRLYRENIDFQGKDIVVRSIDPSDPAVVEATVIDGGGVGTVVTLSPGTIRGFTIRGGLSDFGGGVHAGNRASVLDNVITANSGWAAGVYADGDVLIEGNTIRDNVGRGVAGRTRTLIRGNQILRNAGGVYALHNCTIENNAIVGNSRGYFGGLYVEHNVTVRSNLIAGNYTSDDGAGINAEYHSGLITSNTLLANVEEGYTASGIFTLEAQVANNIVAFSPVDSPPLIVGERGYADYNCVYGNAGENEAVGPHDVLVDPKLALGAGGVWSVDAVYADSARTTTLTDASGGFTPGALVGQLVNPDATQELHFAVVANTAATMTVMGDACAFDQQTQRCDLARAGDSYQLYNYHLDAARFSPCIEAGDPTRPIDAYDGFDIDGDSRVLGCRPDIGADETVGGEVNVLVVESTMTTPRILVSRPDCQGLAEGIGSFNRFYTELGEVRLTAERLEFVPFRWIIDGQSRPRGVYDVTVDLSEHVHAEAEYAPVWNTTRGTVFVSIQPAIADFRTRDGDEIIVAPSVYRENIDFLGKAFTLRSADPYDPEVVASTIIDGGIVDSVVVLMSGTLTGFTLRNGTDSGVQAYGSAVVCRNVITGCRGNPWGGGIQAEDSATICHNTVTDSYASNGGGGIAARHDVLVLDNRLMGNTVSDFGEGAGLHIRDRVVAIGNLIAGNTSNGGGGVRVEDDSLLVDSIVADNVSNNRGGGVSCGDDAVVQNNLVTGNESRNDENGGGGIYAYHTGLIWGNAIVGNCSAGPGGGAHVAFGSDLFANTIVDNTCTSGGCGVHINSLHEQFYLLHNLIAFNPGGFGVYAEKPVDMDYNCVYGHDSGDYGGLAEPGTHDVSGDPMLADGGIHLTPGSSCLNAADPNYLPPEDETDIDGQPRIGYGRVDIGADEMFFAGDSNEDCRVDLHDFAALQRCHSGDGRCATGRCLLLDADHDCDIDGEDLAALYVSRTGPGDYILGCPR